MATVQLIEQPSQLIKNPVENCVEWCFDFQDVITNEPEEPQVCIIISLQYTYDNFTFAGVDFEVGTGDGQLDLNVTDLQELFDNFINGITCHPVFSGKLDYQIPLQGTEGGIVCFYWKCPEPLDDPTFDFSSWSPEPQVAFTDGVAPEYVPGFELLYQLFCYTEDEDGIVYEDLICKLQNAPMLVDEETGEVLQNCIDLSDLLSNQVRTQIPDCSTKHVYDESICKQVFIKYGSQQIDDTAGCGTKQGTFSKSGVIEIINQAINCKDGSNGVSQYNSNGTFLDSVKFLTTGPRTKFICEDTCDWLWINLNFNRTTGFLSEYYILYQFYDEDGVRFNNHLELTDIEEDGVLIVPSGVNIENYDNMFLPIDWDRVCRYTIDIFALSTIPTSAQYSETFTYVLKHGCCCNNQVYWLDSLGGYSSMGFECIESIDITDTYTEICTDVKCGELSTKLLSGKSQLGTEITERTTLISPKMPKNEDTICMLRDLKASDRKFIIFEDSNGDKFPQSVLVEPGSTRIFIKDGALRVSLVLLNAQRYLNVSQS